MPGKHTSMTIGKQMSKRKIAQDNVPPAWKRLMGQLRKFRVKQGVSTRDVAAKFNTNVSVIAYWERADRAIHPHDLMELLDFLGLEMVIREKEK